MLDGVTTPLRISSYDDIIKMYASGVFRGMSDPERPHPMP